MHDAAKRWVVATLAAFEPLGPALEIGGSTLNGSIADAIPGRISIDLKAHDGVDVVADGATFASHVPFGLIVCCEVFEHAPNWRAIVSNSYGLLKDGGLFVATMAGPGRLPHSDRVNGWKLPEVDEWYRNIEPGELATELLVFRQAAIDFGQGDLRCWAVK